MRAAMWPRWSSAIALLAFSSAETFSSLSEAICKRTGEGGQVKERRAEQGGRPGTNHVLAEPGQDLARRGPLGPVEDGEEVVQDDVEDGSVLLLAALGRLAGRRPTEIAEGCQRRSLTGRRGQSAGESRTRRSRTTRPTWRSWLPPRTKRRRSGPPVERGAGSEGRRVSRRQRWPMREDARRLTSFSASTVARPSSSSTPPRPSTIMRDSSRSRRPWICWRTPCAHDWTSCSRRADTMWIAWPSRSLRARAAQRSARRVRGCRGRVGRT